jgi:5'-phosphate synthase pdxT subunit
MTVGVLALQGDFDKHLQAVAACGHLGTEVRSPEDLARVSRLIIPGGESTTVGMLLRRTGLDKEIPAAVAGGLAVWGTCMGMIIMSREIAGRPQQWTLGLLDVTVQRNAFGAQVHSFEDSVSILGMDAPATGVFIRAPVVTRLGANVEAICHYNGQVVGVRAGILLGTSFHPELTQDTRVHEWFLSSEFAS